MAAAVATAPAPASDVYEVVRAGDSKMACADLRASVEAIEAEIAAQEKAYTDSEMARIGARSRNLSGRGAPDAAVADRQAVIVRQMEMNRRTSHLRQIYFARNCGASAPQ